MRKGCEMGMSLDEVIRCLGINFLLMGYLVCATLVHIAINSSKILKQLEKMNKDMTVNERMTNETEIQARKAD